jgi:large subunit ribosomal protein L10
MARPEKEAKVAELTEQLTGCQAAILTDYRGLKVKEMTDLRTRIREAHASYRVVKNSLLVRALEGMGQTEVVPLVRGPLGVILTSEDPTEVMRAVAAFHKEHGLPVVRGGLMLGRPLSAEAADALATIPPRDRLLAMAVGAFQAPLAGLVTTLQAAGRELVGTLQAAAEKRGAEGAA